MAPIDDKVVAMSFENSQFESGVSTTLSTLDKLKEALKFDGADKGLNNLNTAGQKVDLGHIGDDVDAIRGKLGYLSVAALSVFADIARSAAEAGANFVKSFTFGPIIAGLQEYGTNLNAIQTILANTQASGASLQDVNKALNELNHYSDETIYNFSEMAKNIGTFTAAGVDLKTSTEAIKGIANLAALSGSNEQQAATAMYQLSQAIAAGQVHLQDWNSVVNAGMGGTVFQRALAQTAVAMGKLKEGSLKLVGPMKNVSINGESFRQSMQSVNGKSWLTSDVLTNTLKQFTGDLSNAQLKLMGFSDEQIKTIQITAVTAKHAATQVKTLQQVIDVARETAGSGWTETWQLIFGDFGEAKTTFTNLSNSINAILIKSSDARNKVIGDWRKLGGRRVLINGLKTAFSSLQDILKPIKEAFRDIFPATTGKTLFKLTYEFRNLAHELEPSKKTIENLKRTFEGLFALLDIGKQIVSGIFTVFSTLFKALGGGNGGFLAFTGNIGDFIVAVDKALKKGDALHNFFVSIGNTIAAPIKLIQELAHIIGNLFGQISLGGFSGQLKGVTSSLVPFGGVLTTVITIWDKFLASISNGGNILQPAVNAIVSLIQGIGPAIGKATTGINFDLVLYAIRTALLGGIFLIFKDFSKQLTGGLIKGGLFGRGGLIGNISGAFNNLQGTLSGMQHKLNAEALEKLAIAIGILTLSVVALSFVKPDRLKGAVTALGFVFAELLIAMKTLNKITSGTGFIKLPIIVGALFVLAAAIDLLVIAVLALSRLSWEQLEKGLGGIGVLLGTIVLAVKPLSASAGGLIRAGIGIIAIAVALRILASAVAAFGDLNWTELGKGLIGIGAGLGILVAGVQAIPSGMVLKSAGLIEVVVALKLLVGVVKQFGGMDLKVIGKGLIGIGGGLVVIAAAMHLMPKNMVLMSAGLVLVSYALKGIVNAVKNMGNLSIEQLKKGLIGLAGALGILAIALNAMRGTVGGSAALTIAAAGIALLVPQLVALGKQSWKEIIKSLVTLGGALAIIAGAALLLEPAVPALIGFGLALLAIGAGLALAGAGIALIGIGLSAVAVAGPAAVGILVAAITQLAEALPVVVKHLVEALLVLVQGLAKTAPAFVAALVKIVGSLLDVVIKSAPKIAEAFDALLTAALKILADNQDKLIAAGLSLIISLLKGIRDNISEIVDVAVQVIVNFLDAVARNLGKIVTAGAGILVKLLQGIGDNLAKVTTAAISIITKFLDAIAKNLGKVVTSGLGILTSLLGAISGGVTKVITAGTNLIINLITGIVKAEGRVVTAGVNVLIAFIKGLSSNTLRLANAAGQAIVDFINGLTKAINTYAPEIRTASAKLGFAIIDGITFGLASKSVNVYNKAKEIGEKALKIIAEPWKWGSPSKTMHELGVAIVQGLANGLGANSKSVYTAADSLGNGLIQQFKDLFQISSPSKVMQQIGEEVGEGFAQGLRGSKDDINNAFKGLNKDLLDAMETARENITEEKARLAELNKNKTSDAQNDQDAIDAEIARIAKLRAAKKVDAAEVDADMKRLVKLRQQKQDNADADDAAIKKSEATLAENERILKATGAAHTALIVNLKDEHKALDDLAVKFATVSKQLDDATEVLNNAKQARDDAIKNYADQYSQLPDIAKTDANGNPIVDQLTPFMQSVQAQIDSVGSYTATLDQLRKLGLDDDTYKKLLADGTADQQFATQLLSGGKTAVDSLNKLDTQLDAVSKTLATNAGKNLYQAGVDAAQGLVNGLSSKKQAIHNKMEEIAQEIVQTLRNALKIKSPSQVFAEIGGYAMEGMAYGISNSSKLVNDAVDNAAKDALSAMKSSLSGLSSLVTDQLDTNPVITPVLDLTQVRGQTQDLAALMKNVPITASASFGKAAVISSEQASRAVDEIPVAPGGISVKFEQTNNSPESLSAIDIYRQTKNQLSQLKSVLKV